MSCLSRVAWSLCCCPSCAWWWSCILAGAGANVAGSPSPRRVPVQRQPMRFTTFHLCWLAAMGEKVCAMPECRATTPVAPWASGRHPSWMAMSMTSQTCVTICRGSAWMEGRTLPVRSHAPWTPFRAAMRSLGWTSHQVGMGEGIRSFSPCSGRPASS